MKPMDVVVVGSGAREAAIAGALESEGHAVLVTPGNAGLSISASLKPEDLPADLFVIGPEQPLVDGLADRLRAQGKLVMGPGKAGAILEGSKIFMKRFLQSAGVPTAHFEAFLPVDTIWPVRRRLSEMTPPYVIKTDYLAGGKGVLVTSNFDEAFDDALAKKNDGGVVIEDGLMGVELSITGLLDGHGGVVRLPDSRDHKRLLDGDRGPMTGGVGAFSPVRYREDPAIFDEHLQKIAVELIRRGIDYRGVIYLGYMLTSAGPFVLEINIRFGDPEAQVILPRVANLGQLLLETAKGELVSHPEIRDEAAVAVVLTAEGYPDPKLLKTGDVIAGINGLPEGITLYPAGVAKNDDGQLVTAGGRVLTLMAMSSDVAAAREKVYCAVAKGPDWPGVHYRTDIGLQD